MVWNQSRDEHLRNLEYLTDLFQKYFPKTPVYSAVGNHESVPVNRYGKTVRGSLSRLGIGSFWGQVGWVSGWDGQLGSWTNGWMEGEVDGLCIGAGG